MPAKQNVVSVKKQSGSALIIAVFIIIVISLLGASLVSLQKDSAESASYEVYATRAYLAAYSASEIALAQLFPLNATSEASCTNVKKPILPANNAGFHGCNVSLECTSEDAGHDIGTRYKVLSIAICKSGQNNQNSQITTRRQITVEATSL